GNSARLLLANRAQLMEQPYRQGLIRAGYRLLRDFEAQRCCRPCSTDPKSPSIAAVPIPPVSLHRSEPSARPKPVDGGVSSALPRRPEFARSLPTAGRAAAARQFASAAVRPI